MRASRRNVADAFSEWLSRIEHSIKPSMVQNWRNYATNYVVPYIGNRVHDWIVRRFDLRRSCS